MARFVSTAEWADAAQKHAGRDALPSTDVINSPRRGPANSHVSSLGLLADSGLAPARAASARAPQKWNTSNVWNAAVCALRDTKNSIRLPGQRPKTSSPAIAILPEPEPASPADASPHSVLSVFMPYDMDNAEDACTLSGASCNRRTNARRSNSSTVSSCSGLSLDSPASGLSHARRSTACLLEGDKGKLSAAASPVGGVKRTPLVAASQSAHAVVKSAAASAAMVRKAISSPLEKAGIISRSSANKEKQE